MEAKGSSLAEINVCKEAVQDNLTQIIIDNGVQKKKSQVLLHVSRLFEQKKMY